MNVCAAKLYSLNSAQFSSAWWALFHPNGKLILTGADLGWWIVCLRIDCCSQKKLWTEVWQRYSDTAEFTMLMCESVSDCDERQWAITIEKQRDKTDHVHPTRLTWHTYTHLQIHIAYKVYADWLHILIHAFGCVPIWLSFNLRSSSLLLFFFSFLFFSFSFNFVCYCCWLLTSSVHVLCVRSVNVDLFKFSVKPWAYTYICGGTRLYSKWG